MFVYIKIKYLLHITQHIQIPNSYSKFHRILPIL